MILDPLSPAELYKYARTCKNAQSLVHAYIRRRFQLHKLLGRYFSDAEILEFRLLQFNTGRVISGSAALQFFNRTVYAESDLDLYVEHRYRKSIAIWLRQIGYQYTPHSSSTFTTLDNALWSAGPGSALTGIKTTTGRHPQYYEAILVLTFEKHHPYRKVQVITSMFNPISKVLRFHSSELLNDLISALKHSEYLCSLCHEYHNSQQGLLLLPARNIRRKPPQSQSISVSFTACDYSQGIREIRISRMDNNSYRYERRL